MRDQRNAARPEARVLLGARHLLAELGRELAVHRRGVDADLLEDAAMHHRHDAAAALAVVALPVASARSGRAPTRHAGRSSVILDRLEGRADAVAQRLEPGARLQPSCPRCRPAGRRECQGGSCAFSAIRPMRGGRMGAIGTRLFGRRSLICSCYRVKEFFLAHPGKTAARWPEEEAGPRPQRNRARSPRDGFLRETFVLPRTDARRRPGNGSTAGPSRPTGPRSKAGPSVRTTSSSSPSGACRLRTDQRSALPSWRRASPAAMAAARATLRLRPPPGIGINTR